jgi:cytochrome c-type biogenesis protein CcmE
MSTSKSLKVVIGLAIVVPVLLHLLYAAWASPLMAYYVTVGELRSTFSSPGSGAEGKTMVRVGGEVVPGSVSWDKSRGELGFLLTDGLEQLDVVYPGPAPDAFRAGVTAIVEGQLDQGRRFLARKLLLKCPHQYVAG